MMKKKCRGCKKERDIYHLGFCCDCCRKVGHPFLDRGALERMTWFEKNPAWLKDGLPPSA